jgi:hypothetical protein
MSKTTQTIRVKNPYRFTVNIKSGLFILAIGIIFGFLVYTQYIVERLRDDSRHIAKIYTQMIARIGLEDANAEYNFVFDEIIKRIEFPIINTDPNGVPVSWRNIDGIPNDNSSEETIEKLKTIIPEMDADNEPIPILYETTVLGYIHYDTDTHIIREIEWLPVIQLAIIGAFILIGYIGFSNIKRSEQRMIWIGMAKETAHQMATPLSSLMGWIELLRHESEGRDKTMNILNESEDDLKRLDKIVTRFSQIGSTTDLKKQDIVPLIRETAAYFRKRLPQSGRTITVEEQFPDVVPAKVNPQLFTWVIENVIKNAIDAIENSDGFIKISVSNAPGLLLIDIQDNGRGIELKNRDNVFRPGYSTKKRGWGLGLSLARRIIEDYHHGKIYVKESRPNEGTTMRIQLKSSDNK